MDGFIVRLRLESIGLSLVNPVVADVVVVVVVVLLLLLLLLRLRLNDGSSSQTVSFVVRKVVYCARIHFFLLVITRSILSAKMMKMKNKGKRERERERQL